MAGHVLILALCHVVVEKHILLFLFPDRFLFHRQVGVGTRGRSLVASWNLSAQVALH